MGAHRKAMYKRASEQNPRFAPLLPDDPRPIRQPRRQPWFSRKTAAPHIAHNAFLYPLGPRGSFRDSEPHFMRGARGKCFGRAERRIPRDRLRPENNAPVLGAAPIMSPTVRTMARPILLAHLSSSARADRPAIDSFAIRARKGARETTPQTSSPQRLKNIRHAKILHFSFAQSARTFPGRAIWPATRTGMSP